MFCPQRSWWVSDHLPSYNNLLTLKGEYYTTPPSSFLQYSYSLTSMFHFLRSKNNNDYKSPITLAGEFYPELTPSSSCFFHHSARPTVFTHRTAALAEGTAGWFVFSQSCYWHSAHSHIPGSPLDTKLESIALSLFQAGSVQISAL